MILLCVPLSPFVFHRSSGCWAEMAVSPSVFMALLGRWTEMLCLSLPPSIFLVLGMILFYHPLSPMALLHGG